MQILRQSTSVTVSIGPAIDITDITTPLTGLTLTQAKCLLTKNGGTQAQKNETSTCSHDRAGWYKCTLNTTDTATLGALRLVIDETSSTPIWADFHIVTANVYDTLFSTDYLDVNLVADQSAASIGLSAAAVDAIFNELLSGHTTPGTLGKVAADVNQATFGKWAISGTTLTMYASDNVSVLKQFTLNAATSPTSRTPI